MAPAKSMARENQAQVQKAASFIETAWAFLWRMPRSMERTVTTMAPKSSHRPVSPSMARYFPLFRRRGQGGRDDYFVEIDALYAPGGIGAAREIIQRGLFLDGPARGRVANPASPVLDHDEQLMRDEHGLVRLILAHKVGDGARGNPVQCRGQRFQGQIRDRGDFVGI